MIKIKKADNDILMPLVLESIRNGNDARINISGYSMYPLVSSHRDSVLLTGAACVKKGDVPLILRPDGRYVLHRVVKIKDGAYALRGDYEQKKEYPVSPECVVAVAKGFYRNNRYISCDSFIYKLYKVFWMNTVFIRPLMLKLLAIRSAKIQKKSKKNVES